MFEFEIHSFISLRRIPVTYSEKKVEPEKLLVLFEAARWAPSSRNVAGNFSNIAKIRI